MTIPGIEFGYAAGEEHEWCAKRTDVAGRMLCGRRVSWMPAAQPVFTPDNLHQRCRELLYGNYPKPRLPQPETGVCPECGGEVWLDDGLVAGHGRWVVGVDGPVVSGQPCDGAGQTPDGAP